ncbi:MAG: MBL fold metallo-hydrolase [Fibrobacteres bacterium]|nr:MBL fold metallo-hydrolase [Fibrobacterota bacterium]
MVYIIKIILTIAIICFTACSSYTPKTYNNISFIDVGQGDAALIQNNGENILIDCGPDNGAVDSFLTNRNIDKIDWLILSHNHADHCGALQVISAKFAIGHLLFPRGMKLPNHIQFADTISLVEGDMLNFQNELKMTVLWPCKIIPQDADSANHYSLVCHFQTTDFSALFAGDIDFDAEKEFINSIPTDVNFLKIPHHGSKNSTSWEFIEKLNPFLSVVSVGNDNDYGLPDSSALFRINAASSVLRRTDIDGTITINCSEALSQHRRMPSEP